jgi:DNA-binding transcriptional MerR regulator
MGEGCVFGRQAAARAVGVAYYRVVYAHRAGLVPEPGRVGSQLVFTPDDIDRLREHFTATGRAGSTIKINNCGNLR